MPKAPRAKKEPPPPKPWQRAEAGRYRSSDDRFTLESEGSGRWFVTDAEALDELGLARTSGPYATLDEAKAAADAARERAPEASPFADRIKEAASKPRRRPLSVVPDREAPDAEAEREPGPVPEPEPEPPKRTWLDELEDRDRETAARARRMIAVLEREGIDDAESLVRRDILGNEPIVATRLAARDVLAAIARLDDPSPAEVAVAVADVLAASRKRSGLPGWRMVERGGPDGEERGLRLTPDDLRDAGHGVVGRCRRSHRSPAACSPSPASRRSSPPCGSTNVTASPASPAASAERRRRDHLGAAGHRAAADPDRVDDRRATLRPARRGRRRERPGCHGLDPPRDQGDEPGDVGLRLDGPPTSIGLRAGGGSLPITYQAHADPFPGDTPGQVAPPVVLAPGASATAKAIWRNWCLGPADVSTVWVGLRATRSTRTRNPRSRRHAATTRTRGPRSKASRSRRIQAAADQPTSGHQSRSSQETGVTDARAELILIVNVFAVGLVVNHSARVPRFTFGVSSTNDAVRDIDAAGPR